MAFLSLNTFSTFLSLGDTIGKKENKCERARARTHIGGLVTLGVLRHDISYACYVMLCYVMFVLCHCKHPSLFTC
jgi:hypothetical protein